MNEKERLRDKFASKPKPFAYLGDEVTLRPITFGERATLATFSKTSKDSATVGLDMTRKVAALALCNGDGKPIFTEEEIDELDGDFVQAIATEAAKRCGLYAEDGEKKVDSTTQESPLPTNSPAPAG